MTDLCVEYNKIIQSTLLKINSKKENTKNKLNRELSVYSVSQSSYDCYLKQYLDILMPVLDKSVLGTFIIGDKIHDIVQESFVAKGAITEVLCTKSYDYKLDDTKMSLTFVGHADIVYNNLVIEIKSVSPFAWKYYVTGFKDKSGTFFAGVPKLSHIRQLNMYMDLLNLTSGVILYINKDNLKAYPHLMQKDEFEIQQTIGRCITVNNCILTGKLPPKVKGAECSYCSHKQRCKTV